MQISFTTIIFIIRETMATLLFFRRHRRHRVCVCVCGFVLFVAHFHNFIYSIYSLCIVWNIYLGNMCSVHFCITTSLIAMHSVAQNARHITLFWLHHNTFIRNIFRSLFKSIWTWICPLTVHVYASHTGLPCRHERVPRLAHIFLAQPYAHTHTPWFFGWIMKIYLHPMG